uniref:DNA binding / catalytic/ nuclease n=1 Tax=Arundo donax TaxID=35708 RepID=A0A0A9ABR6_ARUDO
MKRTSKRQSGPLSSKGYMILLQKILPIYPVFLTTSMKTWTFWAHGYHRMLPKALLWGTLIHLLRNHLRLNQSAVPLLFKFIQQESLLFLQMGGRG